MGSKLDKYSEKLFNELMKGDTYSILAKRYKVDAGCVFKWFHRKDNIDRYQAILSDRADFYADKGEEVLLDCPADKAEIMRARELSQHYRWRASKSNPKRYGDSSKIELAGKLEVKQITGMEIK